MFAFELLLLVAFVIAVRLEPAPPPDDWRFLFLVALPTVAMRLQSATVRRIGELHLRTTYISGVLTSLVEDVVKQVMQRPSQHDFGVRVYSSVWVGYLVGGVMGGLSFIHAGALGMIMPIVGLAAAMAFDMSHPYELASDSDSA